MREGVAGVAIRISSNAKAQAINNIALAWVGANAAAIVIGDMVGCIQSPDRSESDIGSANRISVSRVVIGRSIVPMGESVSRIRIWI